MGPIEPTESSRTTWGVPLAIAAVVGGLVVYRSCTGRGSDGPSPAAAISTTQPEPAAAPKPPVAPRCAEVSPEPFIIGEPLARRAPQVVEAAEAGPPDELAEEPEDDLAPFAVEIGRGALFSGGFALGARRDAEGGAVAMVATLGLDGTGGKLIRLGRSRGDLDAPVVTGAGDAVLAALLEPNASGRSIRIAKVAGGDVTWGIEFAEGRDESLALDIAASGPRAIVVWDDTSQENKRSNVMLASFDVATMRSVTSARPVSSPKIDADTPRIVARPGGYWLGYIARAEEAARAVKKDKEKAPRALESAPRGAGSKAGRAQEDSSDEDESGEAIQNAWIELLPLDENGAPVATPRAITPRDGHALAFDLELGADGGALIAFRDDDIPTGGAGGRLIAALAELGGKIETHTIAEESLGAGVPDLLPGFLVISGGSGATKLASITARGERIGSLDPEPSLGTGEPLAATADRILIARTMGRAMRLSVVRCSPAPAASTP